MANKIDKTAERIRELFDSVSTEERDQWEFINQKGYDFAHDNQLTQEEKIALEEQGMPTFTINRILPVVEMLNFYAKGLFTVHIIQIINGKTSLWGELIDGDK